MTKWVTVSEASVMLGMSERTIRRHVAKGSIEARIEGGRRYIGIEDDADKNANTGGNVMTMLDKDDMVKWLKNELEERNKQMDRLQEEIKNNRERSDSIIMKLAEEIEFQRQICQGLKPERKRDKSFWRLLGKSGNDTKL